MASETPTEGRCNAEKDGLYCEGWPSKDEDGNVRNGRCWHHGGAPGSGAQEGNQNAKKHGAFSDHFRSDLTEEEIAAIDAMLDHLEAIDDERSIAAEIAAEALVKYKRAADTRFLREARQWMSDFNLLPNEDVLEHTGSGGSPLEVVINRERYTSDDE